MIGAADVRYCERCKRGRPHTRRGECKWCLSSRRRAKRRVRQGAIGTALESYRELLEAADRAWSAWVRAASDACEMCRAPLPPSALQCAHGFSRVERAIRFDPDNTFALCAACHRRHTPPRADWWDWMRERLQQRLALGHGRAGADAYTRLELASRARGGKLTAVALTAVIADARQRIEALPEGDRKEWARETTERALARLTRFAA